MGRVELKISYECPACKQINEANFSQVVNIETVTEYGGSGSYFAGVHSVGIICTGCKVETEIEWQ